MKNKKFTYFLIVAVVGLWGAIIYQVIARKLANQDNNDGTPTPAKLIKEAFDDYSMPKDTAKLMLNYRDPFGLTKKIDTVAEDVRSRGREPKLIPHVNKPSINWSFITYLGYIRNPASKKLVALVNINGQSIAMAEGETRNQVKLIRNLKDSIKVSYSGSIKFIAIKSSAQ